MSKRNGDRARFQRRRLHAIHRRARVRVVRAMLERRASAVAETDAASAKMADEGGPARVGD